MRNLTSHVYDEAVAQQVFFFMNTEGHQLIAEALRRLEVLPTIMTPPPLWLRPQFGSAITSHWHNDRPRLIACCYTVPVRVAITPTDPILI
jgi:hypothetical protein